MILNTKIDVFEKAPPPPPTTEPQTTLNRDRFSKSFIGRSSHGMLSMSAAGSVVAVIVKRKKLTTPEWRAVTAELLARIYHARGLSSLCSFPQARDSTLVGTDQLCNSHQVALHQDPILNACEELCNHSSPLRSCQLLSLDKRGSIYSCRN